MVDFISNIKDKAVNVLDNVKSHISSYFIVPTGDKGTLEYTTVQLKLDIIGEETLTADSDVTDHYVESNIAYQDQISLKPKIYTIQGEVGELVWYQKDANQQVIGQVAQKLEGIISFLPIRSKSFSQMKSKVMKGLQWVDTASNVFSKLDTLSNFGNNQIQAYSRLCEYRDVRQPLNVQTPWGMLQGYVITNLKFIQPRETKDKTFISITFKEFRTTSVSTVPFNAAKYQANAAFENQPKRDNGKTSGVNSSVETYSEEQIKNSLPDLWKKLKKGDTVYISEDKLNSLVVHSDGDTSFLEKKGKEWAFLPENLSQEIQTEFENVAWKRIGQVQ